jgi:hypothetical protein
MGLPEDRRGQIYTIEGIVASLILLSVLYFILQSNSIIVPQTERSIDMKLYEKAGDTMICLDRSNNDSWSNMQPLESYITAWDGNYLPSMGVRPDMTDLDNDLASMLSDQIQYNLNFTYIDASHTKRDGYVIYHGTPGDNSVVSTRLITLNQDDVSSFWNTTTYNGIFPHVVQVKLTCWYL